MASPPVPAARCCGGSPRPSRLGRASCIAGIILKRCGHALSVPYPGFYGGASGRPGPGDIVRRHYGRIAFGHAELDGLQHWGPAADAGRRAVGQIIGAI
jgi:spermidine dehydrogenase